MTPADFRLAIAGFGALLIAVGLGRFGYPPIIPSMIEAGWTTPAAAHAAGAWNLAGYVLGALLAAPALRLFGARPAIVAGAVGGVLAFALSVFPLPDLAFQALRGLSGLAGGIVMILMPPVVASAASPDRRGAVGGLAFAGVGAGFVFSGLAVPAMAGFGPGGAWAALTLVLAAATVATYRFTPRVVAAPSSSERAAGAPSASQLTSAAFIGLGFAYIGPSIGYVPHTLYFADYVARDLGHGLAAGGAVWGLAGIVAVLAPAIAGPCADRWGFAPALRIVVSLMTLGCLIAAFATSFPLLALSGMLAGGLMVGLGSLASGRAREIVGAAGHTRAWSAQTIGFAIGQASAAAAFTALLAAGAAYTTIFAIAALVMGVGLAMDLVLARATARKRT